MEELCALVAGVLLAEFCRVLAFTPTQQNDTMQYSTSQYRKNAVNGVQTG